MTEWRREAPIRPVVFQDPGAVTEDSVHLHLEQRVAQRLLARFRAQGFIYHDLTRACLAQARDSIPRVILLGRLSLYGRGAERLHEELVPVAARWVEASRRNGPLRAYARETELRTLDLLEEALTGEGARVPHQTIQDRLLATAARDIEELLPQLEPRAEEMAAVAVEGLAERGAREERDLRATLERQRDRVVEELDRYDREVLAADPGLQPGGAAAGSGEHAGVAPPPRTVRQGPRSRAGPHTRVLRGPGHAGGAGRPRLPVAGDELSMAKVDPHVLRHLEWIGFVQPSGLVVSAPALARAGAILDRQDGDGQRRLRDCVEERAFRPDGEPEPWLPDFETFARTVLEWNFSSRGYAGTADNPIPDELKVTAADGESLAPDFAVRERSPGEGESGWQLLVRVLEPGQDFDKEVKGTGALEASPHGRMERLLRRAEVKAGLLFNGLAIRLISAPRGESSGWMDFRVKEMAQTSGRPICAAMRLLLRQGRLLSLPTPQRLAALLTDSRRFQNEVSERLAEQVLHALYETLRGFQAAHDASKGELLRQTLAENPDRVYHALLTVILRLVFLLYAEERDMLPKDETFQRYYSLVGLYERLREDAALNPDTMDQRYGAWAQLLVLFRLIHDGAKTGEMSLPRRHGVLFDPDRFPFLEGRPEMVARQIHERVDPPLVPDGTIYRALEKLLVLDGERLSYRALDVEQIGSVYETMMGFRLETASGRSVAIKAAKKQGAPATVDLDALAAEPGARRDKWLRDRADRKLGDKVKREVKEAGTLEDLHAALMPVVEIDATPDLVPQGAMVLQPSEERRRSGSHYTPRELTEPIVRTTLEPILARLQGEDGKPPRPEQILDLKVCDPAMGSGAFLVEACRQLGDALVESWRAYGEVPEIPPDEDEGIFARRLIAQRCLYGVDRNPMAVDLANVSLWLATLARDHPLTFIDHALRHGDSLVGLSRKQIEVFHWDRRAVEADLGFETTEVHRQIAKVAQLRRRIREAGDEIPDRELHDWWDEARFELGKISLFGDLVISAFFEGTKAKEREAKRVEYATAVFERRTEQHRDWLEEQRRAEPPLAPFHWEIEFPEVFDRENPGFDAVVGNPPFAGKNTMAAANVPRYPDWLKQVHEQSHGNADLVAHFFRRAFDRVRQDGTFGLISTNTIAQGDTRSTGLRWICENGGEIYQARRRVKWPGACCGGGECAPRVQRAVHRSQAT